MKVIGLTGGFGTGKTTVAEMLHALGAEVIDADRIARQLLRPQEKVYRKIVFLFGNKILKKGSLQIERKKLARIVFQNKLALKKLNKIIHPEVIRIIKGKLKKIKKKFVVIDAPLLLEAGLEKDVDILVVVKADNAKQIKRLKLKFGLAEEEIKKRIAQQMPLGEKIKKADFLIDNNGSKRQTRKSVERLWRWLNQEEERWKN